MNWIEFVKSCEATMREHDIDPTTVIVRVEVADSYYDEDVTRESIGAVRYNDPPEWYLVIHGGQ